MRLSAPPPLWASAHRSKRVRTSSATRMKVPAASDAACGHDNGSHQHAPVRATFCRQKWPRRQQTWKSARHGQAIAATEGSIRALKLGNLPGQQTLKMKPSSPKPESQTARSMQAPLVKVTNGEAFSACACHGEFFSKPRECLPPAGVAVSRFS